MTLHEAIEKVLKENKRPLPAKSIADIINIQDLYHRDDLKLVEAKQIRSRVKNYPSLFQTINGQIILTSDQIWKNMLMSYGYISNTLRTTYNPADVQFISLVLIFFKRHIDIKDLRMKNSVVASKPFYDYNISKNYLIDSLTSLDSYEIGPPGIFSECMRMLQHLDEHRLTEIVSMLSIFSTDELDDKTFADAFEYFLNVFPVDKYKNVVVATPYSLRDLMVNILDPKADSTVYDPTAGTGGLLIHAHNYISHNSISTEGNEINMRIAQLGMLNVSLHGINSTNLKVKDSFDDFDNGVYYDYILADLPITGISTSIGHDQLYDSYGFEPPRSGNGFGSLVLLILSKLSNRGKAVMTVSESFLIKKGKELEIRDFLVKQDVIESVISLPHGALRPFTDSKASLLILNKRKDPHLRNKIRFIAAKIEDQDNRNTYLNVEDIVDAYKSSSYLFKDFQTIDISELRQDSNLSASSYDEQFFLSKEMIKSGSGKYLSEIVTIRSGIQPEKIDIDITGEFPLVKIENLSRNIFETDLNTNNALNVYFSPKYNRSMISEACILVARIGEKIKATRFIPDSKRPTILIHTGVYALIPSSKKEGVDLEYLYYQFHTSFVLEQIKKRKLGTVMPYISMSGLKEIIIPYLDSKSQKSFIESQKANLISEEKQRSSLLLKSLGSKQVIRQSETEIVKTLTHQLRPKFMDISSVAQRIRRVVSNERLGEFMEYHLTNNDIDPEIAELIQQPDNYSLEKLVDKIIIDTNHISKALSTVEKVMKFSLSDEDLSEIDILAFLKDYKKTKDISINHRYEIQIKGENAIAQINQIAFTELLDQLLQNAEDHGFIAENNSKKYRVQLSVRVIRSRDVISIEYSNNGEPYELQQKDFINAFEKGRNSKGSGIGGNYINRIIEGHGGQLKVLENNPKGFALTIELPINKTINDEQ